MIVYTRHLSGDGQQLLHDLTGKRLTHIRLADAVMLEDHTEASAAFIRLPDRSRIIVRFERVESTDLQELYFEMKVEHYAPTDTGEEEWIVKRRRSTVIVDFGYPVLRTVELFRRHAHITPAPNSESTEAIDYDFALLFRFADRKGFIFECSNKPSGSIIFRYLNSQTERNLKKRGQIHKIISRI